MSLHDSRDYESSIRAGIRDGYLTDDDVCIIREYINHHTVTSNVRHARLANIVGIICTLQRIPPHCRIRDLTGDAIFSKVAHIHTGDHYTQNSKRHLVATGKQFWKYLISEGIINVDRHKINSIKIMRPDYNTTAPDEILTPEEVMSMVRVAGSARNRAIIYTLYESACRISELASLRWRDVITDEHGAKLYIHDTKTQKMRFCRLIDATPHLIEWRNTYGKYAPATGDNPIFISSHKTPLTYQSYCKLLKQTAQRAGITKRVHLHLMRKSRITHLVQSNVNISVIKLMAWGNLYTDMIDVYARLSDQDIDKEILDRAGIVSRDSKPDVMKPRRCYRCGTLITPDQNYCSHCGMSTDPDLIDSDLSVDPELLSRILKILQSQQSQNAEDKK